jgi:hypothetical protein
MKTTEGPLTANGSVALIKPETDNLIIATLSGTYGSVTGVFEGQPSAMSPLWVPLVAVNAGTLVAISGSIALVDNSSVSYQLPGEGMAGVRFRVTSIGSGSLLVDLTSMAFGFRSVAGVTVNAGLSNPVPDPGASGAIPVLATGEVALVSAGAETRTLAGPSFAGQQLLLYCQTHGGNIVVTCAGTVNQTGNNTITFASTGTSLLLTASNKGGTLLWRFAQVDGATLSTV